MDLANFQPWHFIVGLVGVAAVFIGVVVVIARATAPDGQPKYGKSGSGSDPTSTPSGPSGPTSLE